VGILLFLPSLLTLGLLAWVAGGIGLAWVLSMTVLAVFKALANPNEPFRYPFIIHFL
jgi:hypothetical protein